MMWSFVSCIVFFFQAEDGIRDLVRSRGLGDVYKRQLLSYGAVTTVPNCDDPGEATPDLGEDITTLPWKAVSYTHLTLPTSDLV